MKPITVDRLPVLVQPLVRTGWFAVVYKGTEVRGIFPHRAYAAGFIGNVTDDDDREERARYQIVGK